MWKHKSFCLCFSATLILLAGCASTPPPDVTCPDSAQFRLPIETTPIVGSFVGTEDNTLLSLPKENSIEAAIVGAMTVDDPRLENTYSRANIAVLSGGGQFGAYGAGFFESYFQNDGIDVVFDVVTGVSTGALQATAIFLRDQKDLADLVDAYAINQESDLATLRRSFAGLPLETSIYALTPARKAFARFLTTDRLERVAAAARRGRKLLVGVVDVQDGQLYAFDLTAIAASGRKEADIRQCYTEAIFASAAVPIIFPPVVYDGQQYFDGGVRASVFLDTTVKALESIPPSSIEDAKVYVLFNGYLDTPMQDDFSISILDVLQRTREITFDQIDRTSLQSIARLADQFDINWARIEPGLCLDAKAAAPEEDVFNAPFMNCLIREGQLEGARPKPFTKIEK